MSLLYKKKEDQTVSLQVKTFPDKRVELFFTSDCGKHGTHEILDSYILTPERLLEVLQTFNEYNEEELE